MRKSLAAFGLLFEFVALFLPWLSATSSNLLRIYQTQLETVFSGSDSVTTISLVFFVAGLLGGLLALRGRFLALYPGVLSVVSAILWLYKLWSGGLGLSVGTVTGPYLALVGGLLLMLSSAARTGWSTQRQRRPPMYVLKHAPVGRQDRIKMGRKKLWMVFVIWLVGTTVLSSSSDPNLTYLWYGIDLLGVISGSWFGYRYFRMIGNIYNSATLFAMAFVSLFLSLIVGAFDLPYLQVTDFPSG